MPTSRTRTTADALLGLWTVALASFIMGALYFARDILIPLSLAALLTFLLAPLVTRLERWLGRIGAVLAVVAMIFTATGAAGYVLTRQLIDLVTKLPDYKVNLQTKLRSFQTSKGGVFSRFSDTIEELKLELPGGETPEPVVTQTVGAPETATASPPAPPVAAVPVTVVETSKSNPMGLAQTLVAPLLGTLGTAALVLLLLICMLLQREDLRSRLIRLIGEGRISATTRAMVDAGERVSRYLRMQLVVNVTYGIPVAIGLYFIGVPNAVLWGAFAIVLRFIPYVGPWIAAAFPIMLALAAPGWTPLMLTIGLFVVLEVVSNNVMEPWLYGSSTGVSAIALIVAALFWTWLWGPVGLVLSTPLTVCLVVMGRHIPRLAFLGVLLSDEEALTPAEDCYHRLLTAGEKDEMELIEAYLRVNSLTALYDAVLLPVISMAENDHRGESLDDEQRMQIEQSLRDVIDDLGTRAPVVEKVEADEVADAETPPSEPVPAPACRVYCLPSRANRDELAGLMLAQLLQQQGCAVESAGGKLVTGELLGLVGKADVDVVCISVVAPSTVIHARYLCTKLRAAFPKLKIAIGLWGATEGVTESAKRLRDSGANDVFTTLADAVLQIGKLAPLLTDSMMPAPVPADEEERLAALTRLSLLNTEAEPVLDRITAKLARVFDVPIALISLVDRDRVFFKSQTGLPDDLALARRSPRDVSICGHVVAGNEVLVVEDLARDRRFANNPFVKARGLRFYAGAPLRAPENQPIGSLCLLDTKPRQFTDRERRLLKEYAAEVTEEISRRVPSPPPVPAPDASIAAPPQPRVAA
jgi:predicted PurR-regulated permease PerM